MSPIDPRSRWLGACLLAVAASLAALSLLGPLVAGIIHWRIRPTILSQLYGLDAASLAVVAPLAAAGGALSLRGRPLGALLGIGPAAYAVYMVPQYVLGPPPALAQAEGLAPPRTRSDRMAACQRRSARGAASPRFQRAPRPAR